MKWKEKCVPGYVYYATLVGDIWSCTLQKTVEDFPWGHVSKMKLSDRYDAWDTMKMKSIGVYYHKSKAKKALVTSVVERALAN